MHKLALTLLCLCLPLSAGAAMYKWVDKDGGVVFSQTPPEQGNYESIEDQRHYRGNDTDAKKPDAAQEYLKNNAKQHSSDATIKAQEEKGQEQKRKLCEAAKKQLEGLTAFRRVRDKDGNVRTLDDKEREGGINEAKAKIREYCN